MPTLRATLPDHGPRAFRVYKPTMTIGRGEENDIVVDAPTILDAHAQLTFDGRDFYIAGLDKNQEVAVNGKRRSKQRLGHNDVMRLGAIDFVFSTFDEPTTD